MMISKERIAVAFACILLLLLMQLKMLSSVPEKVNAIHSQNQRIIITSESLAESEINPDAVFDRELSKTCKIEFTNRTNTENRSHLPDEKSTYLQMDLSLTHFPGTPPVINPLKHLIIWPGTYKGNSYLKKYARPSKIRLVFFKQELVDVDREFRLSDPPSFIAEKTILLPDAGGPQIVDLDFLPAIEKSNKFPENIYQISLRIEILGIYPGQEFKNTISIAEIDYVNTKEEHKQFQETINSIKSATQNSSSK